jgi:hypothetical protein
VQQQRFMKGLTLIQETENQVDEANALANEQSKLLDQADSWSVGSSLSVFIGIALIAAGVYRKHTVSLPQNNISTTFPGDPAIVEGCQGCVNFGFGSRGSLSNT